MFHVTYHRRDHVVTVLMLGGTWVGSGSGDRGPLWGSTRPQMPSSEIYLAFQISRKHNLVRKQGKLWGKKYGAHFEFGQSLMHGYLFNNSGIY